MENDTKVDEKETLTAYDLISIMERHVTEMEKQEVELSYIIGPKISEKYRSNTDLYDWIAVGVEENLGEKTTTDIKGSLNFLREILQGSESDVYKMGYHYKLNESPHITSSPTDDDYKRKRKNEDYIHRLVEIHFKKDTEINILEYPSSNSHPDDFEDVIDANPDAILDEVKRNYKPLKIEYGP